MERYLLRRGLNRLILLPIVLAVAYAIVLLWQLDRMLVENDWIQHTSEIRTASSDAQRHIQFQESALRGYLLTNAPLFERQFAHEDSTIDSVFQGLHSLELGSARETRRLDSIMQFYWSWQASAKHALTTAQLGILDTSVLTRAMLMESMRALFRQINTEERALYAERLARLKSGTMWLTISIASLSVLIGLIVGGHARRQTKQFVNRLSEAIDETSRSRELLETTLLSIGDAIIVVGQDRRITLMNGRAERLTGWAKEEAIHRSIADVFRIVHEETRAPIENPVHAVLRERKPVDIAPHSLLLSRTGVDYPIEDSAAPIHSNRGEIVGVVLVFRDISERREDERGAEQREREFRALIEKSPDVVTRYARDLTIIYANPAIEQVLGISAQSIAGRRYKDVGIPEEIANRWERDITEVFETGRSMTTEEQYQSVRGMRSYHSRLVPEIGERGVESVIAIARDITEMKQTEERLRESEQRFRSIVEHSPDAFYLMRAVRDTKKDERTGERPIVDFVFEYLNSHASELITLRASDLLGKRLSDVFTGERPKQFLAKYAEVIRRGIPTYEDYRVQSKFVKSAKWLHSQYLPIGDLLAITTTDITNRMEVDRALRRSEERYRRLVESASEAIFSTDKTGRFTYANPYVRNLGGYANDDVTKFYFADLVAADHRERVKRHFFRQFLSRTPYSYIDAPFLSRDGAEKWLSVTTSLRQHGEEVDGFDCIATDISDRKRMEVELQSARDHEEDRVSAELTRMSGALRGPLREIQKMSESIASNPADPGDAADVIKKAVEIMLTTIDNSAQSKNGSSQQGTQ